MPRTCPVRKDDHRHSLARSLSASFLACATVLLLAACNSPGAGTSGSGFGIDAAEERAEVTRGDSAVTTVLTVSSVRDEGHVRPIHVSVEGLPAGVTSESATIGAHADETQVELQVAADAALGLSDIEITATDGIRSDSTTLELFVRDRSGELDETFGSNGIVTGDFDDGNLTSTKLAEGPGGKILFAGRFDSTEGGTRQVVVGRLTASGTVDESFGSGGTTRLEAPDLLEVGAVEVRDGGFLVTYLDYFIDGGNARVVTHVAAFGSDGRLDTSFGVGGVSTIDPITQTRLPSMTVLPSGQVLLAGSARHGLDEWFAVVRLDADGSVDDSYGDDGIGYATGADRINDFALMPDGSVVLVGRSFDTSVDVAIARFDADGSLDSTFGTDGIRYVDPGGGEDEAYAVHVQGEGILVAAELTDGGESFGAILRFDADGDLDTSFATGGLARLPFGGDDGSVDDLDLQSDGKLVVAGTSYNADEGHVAVARLGPDGRLDDDPDGRPFTEDGYIEDSPRDGAFPSVDDMLLHSDERIRTIGSIYDDATPDEYPYFLMSHWQ